VGRGLLNATGFLFGQNKTECQFSIEVAATSFNNSLQHFMDNRTYFGTLNTINGLAELPVQFNRSVVGCFYSTIEI
jgi:hypothetical protein